MGTHSLHMNMNSDRSVWGVETDVFKTAFFDYLNGLKGDDTDRDSLISRLMWCVDVWDDHRREYFPDSECSESLRYPFFEAPGQAGANEEPAKYKLIGSQGQPSVIAIRHNLLMGTSDLTIWKSDDGERRLILKKDHPHRDDYIERLIVHELLHQWLVEASPEAIRREYAEQTRSGAASNGGEFKTYKGHGSIFANHANHLNMTKGMPLLNSTFKTFPLRHYKVRNAAAVDRQRPSCSWFGTLDAFFVWDPDAEGLTEEQHQENDARMELALGFYEGAVELKAVEAPPVESFEAPLDSSCADVCVNELDAFDQANGTSLLAAFIRRIREALPMDPIAPSEIPTSARADKSAVQYADGSLHSIDDFMDDIGLGDVPMDGGKPKLKVIYPLDRPLSSLKSLEFDIEIAKEKGVTKAEFAQQRFGLPNGQQLSRHLKALRQRAA